MRARIPRHLALSLIVVLSLHCGGGPSDEASGAVQQFWGALNDGDYAGARALYGAEARAVIDDPNITTEDSFRQWAESATKNGSVSEVRVLGSTSQDDGGRQIEYEILYDDGSNRKGDVTVTQEGGAWKLGLVH